MASRANSKAYPPATAAYRQRVHDGVISVTVAHQRRTFSTCLRWLGEAELNDRTAIGAAIAKLPAGVE